MGNLVKDWQQMEDFRPELQVNNYLRFHNFFKVYVLGNFLIGFQLVIYIPAGVG